MKGHVKVQPEFIIFFMRSQYQVHVYRNQSEYDMFFNIYSVVYTVLPLTAAPI